MTKKSRTQKNRTSSAEDDKVDYLTEDPVITEQKFMCISFLKPSAVDDKHKSDKNLTVCGVKIRGSYSTYEEAKARADYLTKCDPYHNIYIGEVGKWCPFEDDPEKAKDSEYMNKDLNKLMKSYWKQQSDANEYHELRKQEMTRKALEELTKKKTEQATEAETTDVDPTDPEVESNDTSKTKKSKKNKEKKLDTIKTQLDSNKETLDKEKKEVDENINTLRRLEDELNQKIKELEEEAVHNALNSTLNEQSQSN